MSDAVEFILSLVIMVLAIVGSASKKARQAKRAAMDKQANSTNAAPLDDIPDFNDDFSYPPREETNPSEVLSDKHPSQPNDDYLEPMARMQAQKNKRYGNLAPKSRLETILLETEEEAEPIQLDLDDIETVKKAILYKEILDPKFDRLD